MIRFINDILVSVSHLDIFRTETEYIPYAYYFFLENIVVLNFTSDYRNSNRYIQRKGLLWSYGYNVHENLSTYMYMLYIQNIHHTAPFICFRSIPDIYHLIK